MTIEITKILSNKFNLYGTDMEQIFLVLNRMPNFLYEKVGKFLVAEDSGFYNSYGLQYDPIGKAFGGCEFIIPLKDGGQIEAKGQWWSSGHESTEKHFGKKMFFNIGMSTEEKLKRCFVFSGGIYIDAEIYNTAIKNIEKINYREYEKDLKRIQSDETN